MKDFRRSMMPVSEDRNPEPAEQAGSFLKQDMRITEALMITGTDTKAAKEKEILDALYYY